MLNSVTISSIMAFLALFALPLYGSASVKQPVKASTPAAAAEGKGSEVNVPKIVRVGGNYVVASVDKKGESAFQIEFKSVNSTGRFDVLRIESDHVHVAVKVGETVRLSAEILSSKGAVAEVSQVVLFLPSAQGPIPVWLLSNKAIGRDLNATRYLEMHAPVNDFVVM